MASGLGNAKVSTAKMAKKEFILQGFTARTHADAVRELFAVADTKRVVLSVAFVRESGVQQIEEKLKVHGARLIVFAGIRNDITTHQGLVRLHSIAGSTLYTVDTGSRNIIFHPKLYLVRGKAHARLVVGSANLTRGGLRNNIEAGMILDFDLTNAADKAIVDGIEAQLAALPGEYPSNIVKISAVSELDAMLASSLVVDEMVVPPPRPTTSAGGVGASDHIPRIKLKVIPLPRPIAKAGALPKKAASPKVATTSGTAAPVAGTPSLGYEAIWQSKPLSRRSLTIPTGSTTNQTGSTTLGKGLLKDMGIIPLKQVNGKCELLGSGLN